MTEFNEKEKNKKKYILMKKMNRYAERQFFQIIRVNLDIKLENSDCLNDENQLNIGTEFTIQEINKGDDSMLREGINYEAYAIDNTDIKSFNFNNIENLVCLIYEERKYGNKCFSSNSN